MDKIEREASEVGRFSLYSMMAGSLEISTIKPTSLASSADATTPLKSDRATTKVGSPDSDDDVRSIFTNVSRPASTSPAPTISVLGHQNNGNPDGSAVHVTDVVNLSSSSSSSLTSERAADKILSSGVGIKEATTNADEVASYLSSVGSARGGCGCGAAGRQDDGTLELFALGISLLALGVATGVIDLTGRKKRKRGEVH
jgi:hypothetical protein